MIKPTKALGKIFCALTLLVAIPAQPKTHNEVTISEIAHLLIKKFEGFSSTAYPDAITGGSPWAYGFGFTKTQTGASVQPGDKISRAVAERRIQIELHNECAPAIKKIPRRTQNQVDAAASFCWNVGPVKFTRSHFYKKWLQGDVEGAANSFRYWVASGTKAEKHLRHRRAVEEALFRAKGPIEVGNLL